MAAQAGLKLAICATAVMAVLHASAGVRIENNISYGEAPSLMLNLRYPDSQAGFPTVVWIHGGGLTSGQRKIAF